MILVFIIHLFYKQKLPPELRGEDQKMQERGEAGRGLKSAAVLLSTTKLIASGVLIVANLDQQQNGVEILSLSILIISRRAEKCFFLLTKNYLINVDEIQTFTKTNKITIF